MPDSNDTIELFGGTERLAALAELLRTLAASGVVLAISSYNTGEVIDAQLKAAGLRKWFTSGLTFGYEACERPRGRPLDKGDVIKQRIIPALGWQSQEEQRAFMADVGPGVPNSVTIPQPGKVEASADGSNMILFVDDLTENILDVRRKVMCCATLLVDECAGGGMKAAEFAAIRGWLDSDRRLKKGKEVDDDDDDEEEEVDDDDDDDGDWALDTSAEAVSA